MKRVNFPLTIDELIAEAVKAKQKFGGNKYILISNDEEGNGYHECYFSFGDATDLAGCYCEVPGDLELEDCVILG
jgi:hypothetical protein